MSSFLKSQIVASGTRSMTELEGTWVNLVDTMQVFIGLYDISSGSPVV